MLRSMQGQLQYRFQSKQWKISRLNTNKIRTKSKAFKSIFVSNKPMHWTVKFNNDNSIIM